VRNTLTEGLDTAVSSAFQGALAQLRRDGAHIEEIDLPELDELSRIQATGGFSAAEAWAWHRHLLATDEARYDPRVAQRIRRGESMSAADYIDLLHARRDWIERVETTLRAFDAILSPTVPLVAPAIDSIATDDAEFFRVNGLMLRNTSVVNMLDGCALSLPCQAPGQLPVGLMVWSGALHDDTVLDVSLDIEDSLSRQEQ
jgi:aspartyl-tRNA(Asn)/glutamyl-tRNA(Gln) amidotransferase subunit A